MTFQNLQFDLTTAMGLATGANDLPDQILDPGHYRLTFSYTKGGETNVSLLWQPKALYGTGYGNISSPYQTAAPANSVIVNNQASTTTLCMTLSAPSTLAAGAGPVMPGPFPGGLGRWRVNVTGTPDATTRVALAIARIIPFSEI